jgi:predicted DNA-binding protein (MmcQ/YjbR family)
MDRAAVVAYCLSRPGAYLDNPWGEEDSVVRVGGKIFCFLGASEGPVRISAKNSRDGIEEWRARYPSHIGVAPYLNKQLWSRIDLDIAGAPDAEEIRELIDISYELIVAGLPKSKRP